MQKKFLLLVTDGRGLTMEVGRVLGEFLGLEVGWFWEDGFSHSKLDYRICLIENYKIYLEIPD